MTTLVTMPCTVMTASRYHGQSTRLLQCKQHSKIPNAYCVKELSTTKEITCNAPLLRVQHLYDRDASKLALRESRLHEHINLLTNEPGRRPQGTTAWTDKNHLPLKRPARKPTALARATARQISLVQQTIHVQTGYTTKLPTAGLPAVHAA